ncbi:MAG: bifunctional [glutamate--ammonia ligase]-adenylyl-L-tyrosine phosphorylase/[glutamate--ammonia-ligase] adenylyltransferase [Deltaproteobacteria bacterium]|nr:bifunctional [glutamate--ammonia ligase]-adenylyl-L-tyrosine phosphorylase/[glutamate--ammonia-ligase] adenylyltransferase [Deltaproteobacteria bacterium]
MIRELLDQDGAVVSLQGMGFVDPRGALNNLKLLAGTPFGPHLEEIAKKALASPSPEGALNNLEAIAKETPSEIIDEALKSPLFLERIVTVAGSSPFLSGILARNPEFFDWLFLKGGLFETKGLPAFNEGLQAARLVDDYDALARALRIYKQKEYLRIGARDLLGLSELSEVTAEISDLASACLDAALAFSIRSSKKNFGEPLYTDDDGSVKEAGFVVIGLGKSGGRELNFSSDIDIIYIYTSDKGETTGIEGRAEARISLHAFFVKTATLLTKLIGSVTGDGFVFRIDLDLRPEGRSGDVANSLRSAEIYYESWGQMWERAAMIKARPIAGDASLGEAFISMIRPFVFRRYLDFTALDEVKSMKEKIDLSLLRRNPDTIDVKLGAGGIREIEFFCQALQLIHAGKDAEIRERTTLKAIDRLSLKGYIKKEEARVLSEGYVFLRDLEHRIQIVEGRQSQAIPARKNELERLARMMGFRDTESKKAGEFFWEKYKETTLSIHEVYRSLFYKSDEGVEVPKEIQLLFLPEISETEAIDTLSSLGFKDAATAYKNLVLIRTGPPFIHLSAKARVLLQKLGPLFLSRAASSPDPDKALNNLERFLSSIGARTTFYSLLAENPLVTDELLKLFGTSEFLSHALIERPEGLDLLLSKELAIPYKTRGEVFDAVSKEVSLHDDYEEKLDALRRVKNQEILRIGVNDVRGELSPHAVSRQMTFTAEAALASAIDISIAELVQRYGSPGEARFVVLGLGKLGGGELIYGSDLDVVFVYSDSLDARTTGPKSITAHEFFVKLGQRIISVLTLRTREGFVFNVDARLRPSGSSGPLVVSKESFLGYHAGKTQVWERQALVRARPVAGDLKFGSEVLNELFEIACAKPLSPEDVDEMLRIRKRMEVEIAKETPSRYNIKTGRGALVDIEFLAQSLQLRWGLEKKSIRTPYTVKALLRLGREGLLGEKECSFLKDAYSFYRLLETRLRIVHDRPEGYLNEGSEELNTLSRRAGYSGPNPGERLLKDYKDFSDRVREIYNGTLNSLKTRG